MKKTVLLVLALAAGFAAGLVLSPRPVGAQGVQLLAGPTADTFNVTGTGVLSGYNLVGGGRIYTPAANQLTIGASGGINISNGITFNGSTVSGSAGTTFNMTQPLVSASALDTCASGIEGKIRRLTGTGGTGTTLRTRLCLCTSDGAASPAYAWVNLISGTVGTTTTCVL